MPQIEAQRASDQLDESTTVIYLEVPRQGVVRLQCYFELYEGLGMVRTLSAKMPSTPLHERTKSGEPDEDASLVCIITSPSIQEACHQALEHVKSQVGWEYVSAPPDTPEGRSSRDMYFGNCINASDIT